jgi:hypothetical protein
MENTQTFRVGEIAVVKSRKYPMFNGSLCIIVHERRTMNPRVSLHSKERVERPDCYKAMSFLSGKFMAVNLASLDKRRPECAEQKKLKAFLFGSVEYTS